MFSVQSKLTAAARGLVRSCRAEMGEIEACPECYAAAHARRPTWFTDVCSTPHILLWAKLKGECFGFIARRHTAVGHSMFQKLLWVFFVNQVSRTGRRRV